MPLTAEQEATRETLTEEYDRLEAEHAQAEELAIQYGLNAKLISLMVGFGTVLSFLTLPVWWQIFEHIAVN